MAVTSLNQVRQIYVATDCKDAANGVASTGDIFVGATDPSKTGFETELYFLYKGKGPEVMRSNLIQVKNITYAKAIAAADMVTPLKKVDVTLNDDLVPGQDYVLRIVFKQFYGMSDEDQYIKDAAVHVTSSMTKGQFFTKMVEALNLAFSREIGATKTSNPYLTFTATTTSGSEKLTITEKKQEWRLGTQALEKVYFDVVPTTIFTVADGDIIWGTATDVTPALYVEDTDSQSDTYGEMIPNTDIVVGTNAVGNGEKIADLEWFLMGERGDQYRQIGWPNDITTEYMVDATKQYDVIEIHYAFTDEGVNSYRSENDITIACPVTNGESAAAGIVEGIEHAANITVATSKSWT